MKLSGIKRATVIAGSQYELAKVLGVTKQAVSHWVSVGSVPMKRAKQINKLYGIPIVKLISPSIQTSIQALQTLLSE